MCYTIRRVLVQDAAHDFVMIKCSYGGLSAYGERLTMKYAEMNKEELAQLYARLLDEYESYCSAGLSLDLSRGKPAADQLDLSDAMLSSTLVDHCSESGMDCRNYGDPYGLPEMRRLFSQLTGIPAANIIVGGNSSLNMMYDTLVRAMLFGVADSPRPWCREESIKFLCPCPGYDRHFGVTEQMGFQLIPVTMTDSGPDMDEVERLVAADASIKGIWCVPKYSNPTGVTYSDETVIRLAKMECAAPDFRIMWDNAYFLHTVYGEDDVLLDIFAEAAKYGHENRIFYFTSTSKITFPGAGVAMMAASEANLTKIKPQIAAQTIGPDKLNQLRHLSFFGNVEGVTAQMKKHAALLRPKFDLLLETLDQELREANVATWTEPNGGYFVSLDLMEGCAKAVYAKAKQAGVTLTTVGATFPYGVDPRDCNLRLAPTCPGLEELKQAVRVLVCVIKLVSVEKLLG